MISVHNSTSNTTSDKAQFDTIIVFGQGPVKPVLLSRELTPQQRKQWDAFKEDPIHNREPNFYLLTDPLYLEELEIIKKYKKLSVRDKAFFIEEKRQDWQHTGHFGLKRMGKQTALAAGLALYSGITNRLIVSGGKTKPTFADKILPKERLIHWPSEGFLLKDVISRNYGKLYYEKYGKSIDSAILIEDAATNTLENFAYSINRSPEPIFKDMKIGFLSAKHHLRRISLLAQIFFLQGAEQSLLSAEELFRKVELHRHKASFDDLLKLRETKEESSDLVQEKIGEERWSSAISDPAYVAYWCGYLGDVKYPEVVQHALKKLYTPQWKKTAEQVFAQVGLPIADFMNENLVTLSRQNPIKYGQLIESLRKLKSPKFRKFPPMPVSA
jgi:hypothetical protein